MDERIRQGMKHRGEASITISGRNGQDQVIKQDAISKKALKSAMPVSRLP